MSLLLFHLLMTKHTRHFWRNMALLHAVSAVIEVLALIALIRAEASGWVSIGLLTVVLLVMFDVWGLLNATSTSEFRDYQANRARSNMKGRR